MPIYAPYVIERSSRGERTYDIFSRLLMDRIVFLGSPINDDVANVVIAQLLFLQADNPEKDINIYINSPGGSVYAGLAIYDTMQYLTAPVSTICMGMAASMGAFLLAAGTKGKRSALPNSRIMIHQPSGGSQGTAADIEIQAKEILYARDRINHIWPSTRAGRWRRSRTMSIATASCRRRKPRSTASSIASSSRRITTRRKTAPGPSPSPRLSTERAHA